MFNVQCSTLIITLNTKSVPPSSFRTAQETFYHSLDPLFNIRYLCHSFIWSTGHIYEVDIPVELSGSTSNDHKCSTEKRRRFDYV
ncbi:hypothetical protein ABKN59_009765 [Abortiporus biennis]